MIISHRLRCVFVHVPKCAGTSLRETIRDELSGGDLEVFGGVVRRGGRAVDTMHYTPAEVAGVINRDTSGYTHFYTVRDPAERWVSSYFMYCHHVRKHFGERPLDPERLARHLAAHPDATATDARYVHFRPQRDYVDEAWVTGERVVLPVEALSSTDTAVRAPGGEVFFQCPLQRRMNAADYRGAVSKERVAVAGASLLTTMYARDAELHRAALARHPPRR